MDHDTVLSHDVVRLLVDSQVRVSRDLVRVTRDMVRVTRDMVTHDMVT